MGGDGGRGEIERICSDDYRLKRLTFQGGCLGPCSVVEKTVRCCPENGENGSIR